MGEAKTRSRSGAQILKAAKRCVYCSSTLADTLEHMPPRGMFKDKDRPSGWEFACCERCNQGTKGADALAQFVAKIEVINDSDWKLASAKKLVGAIETNAAGVMNEIFGRGNFSDALLRRNGLLHRSKIGRADGPLTKRQLNLFASKLAMATFHSFTGRPLELDGLIVTEWYLNGGMTSELFQAIVSIMPSFGQLSQGKKVSGEQFWLRYNTDNKGIVAAFLTFHGSLHVSVIATDNHELRAPIEELFRDSTYASRPTVNITRPGLKELDENFRDRTLDG
jgi:hypothetical protein